MTLALIGWLLCIAVIIVAATAIGAEFDRAQEPWARRIRRSLGIQTVAADPAPIEPLLLTRSAPAPMDSRECDPDTRG